MPSPTSPRPLHTPSSTPSTSTSTIPFPNPQTFDILPQIYDLVTRLPHASLLPQATSSTNTPHPSITDPLDPKDLPQAAVPIKLKIQKAKAVVSALPDVERTIEEQEGEIRGLQERIERLRGVLGGLGRRASEGKLKVDVEIKAEVMEGLERADST